MYYLHSFFKKIGITNFFCFFLNHYFFYKIILCIINSVIYFKNSNLFQIFLLSTFTHSIKLSLLLFLCIIADPQITNRYQCRKINREAPTNQFHLRSQKITDHLKHRLDKRRTMGMKGIIPINTQRAIPLPHRMYIMG